MPDPPVDLELAIGPLRVWLCHREDDHPGETCLTWPESAQVAKDSGGRTLPPEAVVAVVMARRILGGRVIDGSAERAWLAEMRARVEHDAQIDAKMGPIGRKSA